MLRAGGLADTVPGSLLTHANDGCATMPARATCGTNAMLMTKRRLETSVMSSKFIRRTLLQDQDDIRVTRRRRRPFAVESGRTIDRRTEDKRVQENGGRGSLG